MFRFTHPTLYAQTIADFVDRDVTTSAPIPESSDPTLR
jgi:hypothetical protein